MHPCLAGLCRYITRCLARVTRYTLWFHTYIHVCQSRYVRARNKPTAGFQMHNPQIPAHGGRCESARQMIHLFISPNPALPAYAGHHLFSHLFIHLLIYLFIMPAWILHLFIYLHIANLPSTASCMPTRRLFIHLLVPRRACPRGESDNPVY